MNSPPRLAWDVLLVVAIGGAIGTFARWGVTAWVPHSDPAALPWGTLTINIVGCLLMGVLIWFVFEYWAPAHRLIRPFLGVGVLGGFTTFSAFALDLRGLLARDQWIIGLAYVAVSVIGGSCAVWLGRAVASRLAPSDRPFPDDEVEAAQL